MSAFFSDRLALIATLCLAAVGVALVSQHVFDMAPCAWCVFQRLIYLAIALICIVLKVIGRGSAGTVRVAGFLSAALAAAGVAAAWYQYTVASNLFTCDLTFADRFMVNSGLDASMPWLFGIYASCMDARVDVLGIEYALWSLALFVVVGLVGMLAMIRPKAKPQA